jgi:hypothetical protein
MERSTSTFGCSESRSSPVLVYMQGVQPAASAVQLTELLNAAGLLRKSAAAQWLRQQGAAWPAVLIYDGYMWGIEAVQWARGEGCTSPLII